ncbi:hypothetical protein C7M84_020225 [Penaeus vannamei]|uniref:Uncharacterized protein n=1 Tax=Penaeus vannamei TaxID=6689 RepID=A0A3R7P5R8_PENVA|nr:hypothetical protein C7M84_020225 [Penaeus vannamei]
MNSEAKSLWDRVEFSASGGVIMEDSVSATEWNHILLGLQGLYQEDKLDLLSLVQYANLALKSLLQIVQKTHSQAKPESTEELNVLMGRVASWNETVDQLTTKLNTLLPELMESVAVHRQHITLPVPTLESIEQDGKPNLCPPTPPLCLVNTPVVANGGPKYAPLMLTPGVHKPHARGPQKEANTTPSRMLSTHTMTRAARRSPKASVLYSSETHKDDSVLIVAGEEAKVAEAEEGLPVEMLTVDCRVRYQRKKQEELEALLEKYQPQKNREGKKTVIPKRTKIPKENKKPLENNALSDCSNRGTKKVLAQVEMNLKETNMKNGNGLAAGPDYGEDLDSSLINRVSGSVSEFTEYIFLSPFFVSLPNYHISLLPPFSLASPPYFLASLSLASLASPFSSFFLAFLSFLPLSPSFSLFFFSCAPRSLSFFLVPLSPSLSIFLSCAPLSLSFFLVPLSPSLSFLCPSLPLFPSFFLVPLSPSLSFLCPSLPLSFLYPIPLFPSFFLVPLSLSFPLSFLCPSPSLSLFLSCAPLSLSFFLVPLSPSLSFLCPLSLSFPLAFLCPSLPLSLSFFLVPLTLYPFLSCAPLSLSFPLFLLAEVVATDDNDSGAAELMAESLSCANSKEGSALDSGCAEGSSSETLLDAIEKMSTPRKKVRANFLKTDQDLQRIGTPTRDPFKTPIQKQAAVGKNTDVSRQLLASLSLDKKEENAQEVPKDLMTRMSLLTQSPVRSAAIPQGSKILAKFSGLELQEASRDTRQKIPDSTETSRGAAIVELRHHAKTNLCSLIEQMQKMKQVHQEAEGIKESRPRIFEETLEKEIFTNSRDIEKMLFKTPGRRSSYLSEDSVFDTLTDAILVGEAKSSILRKKGLRQKPGERAFQQDGSHWQAQGE